MADVKFCGLTRVTDAEQAVSLGAAYTGFVFAGGPRHLTIESARSLAEAITLAESGSDVRSRGATVDRRLRRVGVFASERAEDIAHVVDLVGLDVVQLHGGGGAPLADALRRRTNAAIWIVAHVGHEGVSLASVTDALTADGLLLDAKVEGALGGTGRSFDWDRVAGSLAPVRGRLPIILAGGLRPENVARAIEVLAPDVVDVSSGVESAPGIKDHARMRAFVDAVQGAEPR